VVSFEAPPINVGKQLLIEAYSRVAGRLGISASTRSPPRGD
jgi:hypothetical protein